MLKQKKMSIKPKLPCVLTKVSKRVVKLDKNQTGTNLIYQDKLTCQVMSREQFVELIEDGVYKDYHVRRINNVKTPVSNPDKTKLNNLSCSKYRRDGKI